MFVCRGMSIEVLLHLVLVYGWDLYAGPRGKIIYIRPIYLYIYIGRGYKQPDLWKRRFTNNNVGKIKKIKRRGQVHYQSRAYR